MTRVSSKTINLPQVSLLPKKFLEVVISLPHFNCSPSSATKAPVFMPGMCHWFLQMRHQANMVDSHYVAFIRKVISGADSPSWVLFNDEKVVQANDIEEMKKFAYVYFFQRA
jgi:hypothetical protein